MAEDPRLILHFKTFAKFKEKLSDGTINKNKHFCVIQETNQFWVRDHFIDGKASTLNKVYDSWEIVQDNAETLTVILKGKRWNNTDRVWESVESDPFTINSATQEIAGLMSATDKKAIDNLAKSEWSHVNDTDTFTATSDDVNLNYTCRSTTMDSNDASETHSQPIGAVSSTRAGVATVADYTQLYTTLPNAISDEQSRAITKENEISTEIQNLIRGCIDGDSTTAALAQAKLEAIGTNKEYSTLAKVAEKLRTFLEDKDLADTTINKWKEIESFLEGITDSQTLLGVIQDAINALDSEKSGNSAHVTVKVTEVDGKISEVEVSESDIASAQGLANEINRATGAESTLQTNINNEASARATADNLRVEKSTVSGGNPTLSWGNTSTIGSVDGKEFKVTMPANPNTDTKTSGTIWGQTLNANTSNNITGNMTGVGTMQFNSNCDIGLYNNHSKNPRDIFATRNIVVTETDKLPYPEDQANWAKLAKGQFFISRFGDDVDADGSTGKTPNNPEIRFYNNFNNNSYREWILGVHWDHSNCFLLRSNDEDGKFQVAHPLIAEKFIKHGGTTTQCLMADGSIIDLGSRNDITGTRTEFTTTQFIAKLKELGYIKNYSTYNIIQPNFSWGNTPSITDSGFGRIDLGGSVIEIACIYDGCYQIKISTINRSYGNNGEEESIFIYRYNSETGGKWSKLVDSNSFGVIEINPTYSHSYSGDARIYAVSQTDAQKIASNFEGLKNGTKSLIIKITNDTIWGDIGTLKASYFREKYDSFGNQTEYTFSGICPMALSDGFADVLAFTGELTKANNGTTFIGNVTLKNIDYD